MLERLRAMLERLRLILNACIDQINACVHHQTIHGDIVVFKPPKDQGNFEVVWNASDDISNANERKLARVARKILLAQFFKSLHSYVPLMMSTILVQDFPRGWVVGPEQLQIHIFRPDVSEAKARLVDQKSRSLIAAVLEPTENAKELQDDFRRLLQDVVHSGNFSPLRTGTPRKRIPIIYVRLLKSPRQKIWKSCVKSARLLFWAAIVAASMDASSKLDGVKVGATEVCSWPLFGATRPFPCHRCHSLNVDCQDTGVADEQRCRSCCIEGSICEAGPPPPEIQRGIARLAVGIRELFMLEQEVTSALTELAEVRKGIETGM
ncbi:hypothetical protein ARMSODRAFT_981549 [Armillaria solidipes]|uniref:Uncharacterized protein n=1 Tax=Armillaria solidipes TaxID=1076256 RepID=A0A2H3B9Y6_9AGAR|nr:hypothetical protein ARMSODRAFT_981549 [Armillaria solidipes]